MCSATKLLQPSLALVLLLAVGIHAGGIGKCNHHGGQCLNIPKFLRVAGDPFCQKMNQIELTADEAKRECGDPKAVCCEVGKEEKLSKRKCDSKDTSKKCSNQGGLFKGDCDTIGNEDHKTPSCTCCVQKQRKCSPKAKYKELDGFCVEKRKYCTKAGGYHIANGCDCKKAGKTHLCHKAEEVPHTA